MLNTEVLHRRTVLENGEPSGKTTNNTGVKTLEMIPGTSGLQIECGLFLWLSSDVGKLLQVMDVPCMGCGELDPIHGGGGHGREVKLMNWPWEVREDEIRLWGCAHHVLGKLHLQQFGPERLVVGDRRRACSMA